MILLSMCEDFKWSWTKMDMDTQADPFTSIWWLTRSWILKQTEAVWGGAAPAFLLLLHIGETTGNIFCCGLEASLHRTRLLRRRSCEIFQWTNWWVTAQPLSIREPAPLSMMTPSLSSKNFSAFLLIKGFAVLKKQNITITSVFSGIKFFNWIFILF